MDYQQHHDVLIHDDSRYALREISLEKLRIARDRLRSVGIVHAAIFGSVARGEAVSESDLDVLVELDPQAKIDLFKEAF